MFIITILEALKERFQNWYLIQRNRYLQKELDKIPSDNIDDYFFDNLTNQFVYKDTNYNVQLGFSNTLNVIRNRVDSLQIDVGSLTTLLQNIEAHQIDIDLNIESVKTLDIDISTQTNKSTEYSGTLGSSSSTIIATIDSEFLYNALTIVMKSNDANGANFRLHLQDVNSKEFLIFTVENDSTLYFNDYYFPSQHYIKIVLYNLSSTATLDYDLKFYFTQQTREVIFTNKFGLLASTTHDFQFYDTNLYNRLSYVFYNASATQDYTINVYTELKAVSATYDALIKTINITGGAGVVLEGILTFTETSNIKIEIIQNDAYVAYAEMNLFFSKIIYDHIQLNNVSANQHHTESHTIVSHSDTTATGAELETLTDGSNADSLHSHSGGSDKTRTIKMELIENNGATISSYGVNADRNYEGFSMTIKLPGNIDASKDIKIVYTWRCDQNTFTKSFKRWCGANKTDGSESLAWNIVSGQTFWSGTWYSGKIYKTTYTIANANIEAGDTVILLIRTNDAFFGDRTIFNAILEYEVL